MKKSKEKDDSIWVRLVLALIGMVQLTLYVLKFVGVITCPWVVVFLPLIISGSLFLLLSTAALICGLVLSSRIDKEDNE